MLTSNVDHRQRENYAHFVQILPHLLWFLGINTRARPLFRLRLGVGQTEQLL